VKISLSILAQRAAITAGGWIIVFREPVTTFRKSDAANVAHIVCFTSLNDMLMRHADLYSTRPASTPGRPRWSAAKRSGSNGGLELLVRLPIPWKQVSDFVGGVIWKLGQHVSEPGLRIDIVHLAGFHEGIDGGGAMAACI
jgi:hypothetical protein